MLEVFLKYPIIFSKEGNSQGNEDGGLIKVDRVTLRNLSLTDVIVCQWNPPLKNRYYKIAMQDVPIIKCSFCNRVSLNLDVLYYCM